MLKKEDFRKIRRRCVENLNVTGGMSLSKDVKDKISTAQNLYDLLDVTCDCGNWMNISVIEKMAGKSQEAKKLIDQYKDKVFSRKIKEVISVIPNSEAPADGYTEEWNKEFDNLRIKDVVRQWNEIEKIFGAEETILFKNITSDSDEICWLIPKDLVERVVSVTKTNQPVEDDDDQSANSYQEFYSETLSLKIGDTVIKDAVTSKLPLFKVPLNINKFIIATSLDLCIHGRSIKNWVCQYTLYAWI